LQEQAAELESSADDLQMANESLSLRTRQAEIANAAKSEFLAAMSHELRTPLNAITGYVDLLSLGVRGPLSDAQHEDLRRIKKSGTHLLSLINEILNLARMEGGQVDLHVAAVHVSPLLEDVAELIAPQARNKGLTLTIVPCAPAIVACTDPERTQQILLNLLTNAVKFTDRGGTVSVECTVDAPRTAPSRFVRIRVSDTGRGVVADKLGVIFEPFVQIDRRLTPDGEQGLGLGLAISRDLARAMGGDLFAESEVGRGSTFTLRLRASPDD
jgi:signal transduction histidine kinase